jgi:large exoprotein involved in heme utilization and adhesion
MAGDIEINATEATNIDVSVISNEVLEGGVGDSGNINITTGSLRVSNGAQLIASTFGQGKAGSVNIIARDTVAFDGVDSNGFSSAAFSDVEETGIGDGGDINITTGSLRVTNGAFLVASTYGQGKAGSVIINARNTVAFDGVGSNGESSQATSRVEPTGIGEGGDINITTGSLGVSNGAFLVANTFGQGKAGSVIINARDTVAFDGVGSNGEFSGAFSNVGGTGIGDGGDINITTGSLRVSNSAQLVAITEGQGNGGKIIVRANTLEAVNGGQVTVSSEGSGIAGTLIVEADAIRLDNKATFSADTSGGGGNINLSTGDLILRRGSSISTNATGSNITGGNITINTDNLVAVPKEDSDISANATESFGGRVIVNATGIFGTQFRPQDTPLSDITASSELGLQFNGVVQLNTPGIDPSRGLANLPTEVVDASNQIDQTCSARGGEVGKNEFIVTGRGGLPPNPSDPLNSDAVWIDLDSTTKLAENRPSSSVATQQTNSTPVQLVEATGWVINDKGQVVLTASAPTAIPYSPGLTISQCHVP